MKPKYQVGDEVWVLIDNKVEHSKITAVAVTTEQGINYSVRKYSKGWLVGTELYEKDIFPTKEALIASL